MKRWQELRLGGASIMPHGRPIIYQVGTLQNTGGRFDIRHWRTGLAFTKTENSIMGMQGMNRFFGYGV